MEITVILNKFSIITSIFKVVKGICMLYITLSFLLFNTELSDFLKKLLINSMFKIILLCLIALFSDNFEADCSFWHFVYSFPNPVLLTLIFYISQCFPGVTVLRTGPVIPRKSVLPEIWFSSWLAILRLKLGSLLSSGPTPVYPGELSSKAIC